MVLISWSLMQLITSISSGLAEMFSIRMTEKKYLDREEGEEEEEEGS